MLIFTFESYLQEMNSREKESEQFSWRISRIFGLKYYVVWGTYKYFQLRVWKITIFFNLYSKPFTIIVSQTGGILEY